jgi:hypothetical protein
MTNASGFRGAIRVTLGASMLWLAAVGSVAAQAQPASVAVFADHYVVAGRAMDDLDALEDAIAPQRPQQVQLTACGDGSARALRAAAHRFRHASLDLRSAGSSDAACQAAPVARAMRVSQAAGPRPISIHHDAVDRWWSNLQP